MECGHGRAMGRSCDRVMGVVTVSALSGQAMGAWLRQPQEHDRNCSVLLSEKDGRSNAR